MQNPTLPQNDPKPVRRAKRLRNQRNRYQYNYDYLSPIAMVNGIPLGEFPELDWTLKVGKQLVKILINNALNDETPRKQSILSTSVGITRLLTGINSEEDVKEKVNTIAGLFNFTGNGVGEALDDYNELFSSIELPAIAYNFREDKIFARMRVAGPNPIMIKKVVSLGDNILSDDFPVKESEFKAVHGFENDTMERAMGENRLYMVDYKALEEMDPGSFPEGQKYIYAPKALFSVPLDISEAPLLPIAVQCGQDPSNNSIITPQSGQYEWLMAKTTVQIADGNYHELITHLGTTHLLVEPFVAATHRRLAENHPVNILLLPHFEGTVFINWAAQEFLIAPRGAVDKLLTATIESDREFAVTNLKKLSFNDWMLPRNLEARGVLSSRLVYPYRDDAEDVWEAIKSWVTNYLSIYYKSNKDIQNDTELQNWAQEISSQIGGRIYGFGQEANGQIYTMDYLIDVLTMIIFTASAQHAAVNFPQKDIMSYTPAMPLAGYAPPDAGDRTIEDWMKMFPPLKMAELQLTIGNLLGGVYHTRLGEYGRRHFKDGRVAEFLTEFQAELEEIEHEILGRNQEDLGEGVEPYHYLRPSEIPQSINI